MVIGFQARTGALLSLGDRVGRHSVCDVITVCVRILTPVRTGNIQSHLRGAEILHHAASVVVQDPKIVLRASKALLWQGFLKANFSAATS